MSRDVSPRKCAAPLVPGGLVHYHCTVSQLRTFPGAASAGLPAESTACYDVEEYRTHQKIPQMQAEQF